MSAVNPYQPPGADVRDAAPTRFSTPRIWSWRGRIGRLRYLAYGIGGYFVLGAVMVAVGALRAVVGEGLVANVLIWGCIAVYLVQVALAGIQRAHDMGWSGWAALVTLIPLVGLIWVFKAGDPGENRWGAPPSPNTLGVKLLAWVLPAVFIVGLLAAVALPAYQQYQMRAKAAAAP